MADRSGALDWLLSSPVPPPVWLPDKAWRHAQARTLIERRFGPDHGHKPLARSHRLTRDLAPVYPFGGSRIVPGGAIDAEVAAELTQLNPPILQGWACIFGAVCLIVALFSMREVVLSNPETARAGLITFFGAPLVWLLAVAGVGFYEREVELQAQSVAIRRWTDVWLRRTGIHVAPSSAVTASLAGPELQLTAGSQSARISTRWWPSSAREEIADEFDAWGVPFEASES